ncbi:MAG: hypothetical protein QM831_23125 [Kofleriaceae bacterium]
MFRPLCVALVAAVGLWGCSHKRHKEHPVVWGAFATGGVPQYDKALDQLLTEDLIQLVIETNEKTQPVQRAGHEAALRRAPAITSRGEGMTDAWNELVDAIDAWPVASTTKQRHPAEQRLRAAAQRLSDQFAAIGLGYHVEAATLPNLDEAILTFRVADVVYVHAGGAPRRVLSLRRIDQTNIEHSALGMQTEELGDPVVLLDQVDGFVADHVIPAINYGTYVVGDDDFMRTHVGARVIRAAGGAIARELAVANRNLEAITKIVVASVRRHEARHGYDNDLDEPLRFPAELSALTGSKASPYTLRARAELTAYLSQIASEPKAPQLALWNLANLGLNKEHRGTAEAAVAVVVITGLARQLGLPSTGAVTSDRHVDRSRLAEIALPLADVSDDNLRRVARQLWKELYGEPLIAIVDPDATLAL